MPLGADMPPAMMATTARTALPKSLFTAIAIDTLARERLDAGRTLAAEIIQTTDL